jgi:hypothetical protein
MFWMFLNVFYSPPLLFFLNKKVCIMNMNRPFIKAMLLNEYVKHVLFNSKLEYVMIQFRLHNIHISDQTQLAIINMPL